MGRTIKFPTFCPILGVWVLWWMLLGWERRKSYIISAHSWGKGEGGRGEVRHIAKTRLQGCTNQRDSHSQRTMFLSPTDGTQKR